MNKQHVGHVPDESIIDALRQANKEKSDMIDSLIDDKSVLEARVADLEHSVAKFNKKTIDKLNSIV
ncbi:MAG: hypothetical protein JRE47_10165 [Deltaproteobacteria bacterium]|nr:hypothetical protein [Deltaproteobacteria bacterium]